MKPCHIVGHFLKSWQVKWFAETFEHHQKDIVTVNYSVVTNFLKLLTETLEFG